MEYNGLITVRAKILKPHLAPGCWRLESSERFNFSRALFRGKYLNLIQLISMSS